MRVVPRKPWGMLGCVLVAALLAAAPAGAAVPFVEITSAGPLTGVAVGNELSCQVGHAGDTRSELFPPASKPGDCGTFVFTGGTLYAPNNAQHDSSAARFAGISTPFTPVSQSQVSGSGTDR